MTRNAAAVLICYAIGILAVGLTIAAASLSGRPPDHFTRDPLSVTDTPFYVGMLSNLGVMMWTAGASVCWFAAWLVWSNPARDAGVDDGRGRRAAALAGMAIIVSLLAVDDLFMLHEEAVQRHLGISENFVLAAYAGMAGVLAIAFRDVLGRTPVRLLLPAGCFFAASIAVDQFTEGFGWRLVIEDSLKCLGIAGLLAYVVGAATMLVHAETT
jgi:hypothetical protein